MIVCLTFSQSPSPQPVQLANLVVELEVVTLFEQPAVVGTDILLELYCLAVQGGQVLVMLHQVVPELV